MCFYLILLKENWSIRISILCGWSNIGTGITWRMFRNTECSPRTHWVGIWNCTIPRLSCNLTIFAGFFKVYLLTIKLTKSNILVLFLYMSIKFVPFDQYNNYLSKTTWCYWVLYVISSSFVFIQSNLLVALCNKAIFF